MRRLRDLVGQHLFRLIMGAGIVVAVALAVVLLAIIGPVPPKTITMAVGPEGEAYYQLGQRYRELLAARGVKLHLVPTNGSVDILKRLNDPGSGVSVGFLQAGMTTAKDSPDLLSLGTLGYEPVWMFYRGTLARALRDALKGKRVSIGPEGSGTRVLAKDLIDALGLDLTGTKLLGLSPRAAAAALLSGELDIAIMVEPFKSQVVHQLLTAEGINALPALRADAHVALRPFLNKLIVPQGVADLVKNRPSADLVLLAPKTSLVVRNDLHPALQYLLLEAASKLHWQPGIFQKAGQFPAAEPGDLPLSDEASQYYRTGSPFLQRYLPFWAVSLAGRLLVIFIPLVGVILPLIRIVPTAYGWLVRHRIFTLYGELKLLETEMKARSSGADVKDLLERLDRLEDRANQLRVPMMFTHFLYTVRTHISLVRSQLSQRARQAAT
jgi:TRAP-type uncharacterized transport system substrate-binding protein